jgi:hypothetical protein
MLSAFFSSVIMAAKSVSEPSPWKLIAPDMLPAIKVSSWEKFADPVAIAALVASPMPERFSRTEAYIGLFPFFFTDFCRNQERSAARPPPGGARGIKKDEGTD